MKLVEPDLELPDHPKHEFGQERLRSLTNSSSRARPIRSSLSAAAAPQSGRGAAGSMAAAHSATEYKRDLGMIRLRNKAIRTKAAGTLVRGSGGGRRLSSNASIWRRRRK